MALRAFAQLDQLAPRFKVPAKSIEVLTSPEDFYERLKTQIRQAKTRVFLASLYIGTSEHELISVIDESLGKNKDLDVHILTDGLRGTREAPDPCSASLLAPLAAKYPARVRISMYQTPKLTGLTRLLLPKRLNEGYGLQHMKIYGIDDAVILSGANLSRDYFTNRQDRYIQISDKQTSQHFYNVFDAVTKLSYTVYPAQSPEGFSLEWLSSVPDPIENPRGYYKAAKRLLLPLLQPGTKSQTQSESSEQVLDRSTALIYPIGQFTPLLGEAGSNDLPVMTALTESLKTQGYSWALTAGYFNVTKPLVDRLLASKPQTATVITASEQANGFYQSKGISKHVPGLYSYLTRLFLKRAEKSQLPLKMLEWRRGAVNEPNGWSYHAKGLWISAAEAKGPFLPFLTVVGSSNFTRRAYAHDLESGAVIVTQNEQLQTALGQEFANLSTYTREITSRDLPKPKLSQRLFVSWFGDRL